MLELGDFSPRENLSVRFGLVACETLTPIERTPSEETTLAVKRIDRDVPASGALSVRFIISEHSMLDRDEALVEEIAALIG